MSGIRLHELNLGLLGSGAVSAAGWRTPDFIQCCLERTHPPTTELPRPAEVPRAWPSLARLVPGTPPAELLPKSPRLRRASSITKFEVAAAVQALGAAGYALDALPPRLGIVHVLQNGCVQYSVRFYAELQVQPELPSPLIFPETVFNAPASHLAQCLGARGMVTTLIGEPNHVVEALFTARQWLDEDLVDACLIVASEESDWLSCEALTYYHPGLVATEGAAALVVGPPKPDRPVLTKLSNLCGHHDPLQRRRTLKNLAKLASTESGADAMLIDHLSGFSAIDAAEEKAWDSHPGPRHSPRRIIGDALGASSALQLVLATHLTSTSGKGSVVSLPGSTASAVAVIR